jgi:TM2 domain-containing membrane protein YozV
MSSLPPVVPAAAPPGPYVRLPKSPVLAVFLSFILPGVGQIYVAQPAKAFVFFFSFVGCIYGAAEGVVFPFAFLIPFVYLFCLIDAYRSAEEANARFLGAPSELSAQTAESPWWGAGLGLLGLVLLLNNLGWLKLASLGRLWPLLLIVAGLLFLYSSLSKRNGAGDGHVPGA